MVCENYGRFLSRLNVQLPLYQLADGFHSSALTLDVFVDVVADNIDVVKEIGECGLYHIGLAHTFVCKWIDNHLDAFFFQMYVDVGSCHHGVSVVVDDPRLAAGDMKLLATERLDLRVLVEGLVEHVEAYLGSLDHVEWLHDDDIHQSIAHRSLWGDVGIVAIL